jgi:hypothetical protein
MKITRRQLRRIINEASSGIELAVQDAMTGGEKLDMLSDFDTTAELEKAMMKVGEVDSARASWGGEKGTISTQGYVQAALLDTLLNLAQEGKALDPNVADDWFASLARFVRANSTLGRK